MPFAEDQPGPTLRLAIKAVPGSRQDKIVGLLGERLKVKVAAPPEDGQANASIARLLARALGVREGDVELSAGWSHPDKVFLVRGRSSADARALWAPSRDA